MNLRKRNDDYKGELCENLFLNKFTQYKKKSNNKFDTTDFKHKTKNKMIELKSRNYNFNHCNDWKVGLNKINEASKYFKSGGSFYIYMMFYDGLYFWKFHPDKINQKQITKDKRVDRGKTEIGIHYNIKTTEFTKSKINICNPLNLNDLKNVNECLID